MQGIDRKQMEAERLARLAKKRSVDDDDDTSPAIPHRSKAPRVSPEPPRASTRSVSPPPRSSFKATPRGASTAHDLNHSSIKYTKGAIKRTWCFKQARDDTDIKLEEVLEKSTLNIAVLSSWQLDTQWLFSKLNLDRTKLYLLMHSKHEEDQEQWRREASQLSKGIRLCFPKLSSAGPFGAGVMHSKLMMLFHPDKLRVVVPSANLMNYDWGEDGALENVVFLIDLPRLPEDRQGTDNNDTLTPFALDLLEYLEAQAVDHDVRNGVLKFDFSQTAHLAFIHTIPGTHTEEDARKTGFPQLSAAMRSLGISTHPKAKEPTEVDFAAGSIGKLSSRIFPDLFGAFRGIDTVDKPPIAGAPTGGQTFRIHFPSLDTVKASIGGTGGAGTLFFAPQELNPKHFSHLRDAQSTRKGVLSHAKMAIVRTRNQAFIYVGSANASEAAWGKMTQPKKGREVKLTARNWECGVVMRLDGVAEAKKEGEVVGLESVRERVPLLFEIPGEPYVKDGEVKKPWVVKESG